MARDYYETLGVAPDGFVEAYDAKYGWRMDPADPGTPLFVLHPRTVLSWDEAALAETMTRWLFE